MRSVAAIPAAGLLAGAVCGPLLPRPPILAAYIVLPSAAALAVWAWRERRPHILATTVAGTFFAGAALLASDAWQHAWRPPLRERFEELARRERALATAEGRVLPEDDEAFAVVSGVLRADASLGPSGVSLSIAVDRVQGLEAQDRMQNEAPAAMGGLLVTVVGSLAADRLDQWRAGRRVRLPVQLRRPTRYLNPDLPDFERALARRGTTLVGTVKSGALVELTAGRDRFAEGVADVRAFARRAVEAAVGRWSARSAAIVEAIVIGDRAGLDDEVQRRLQEAGTYHVIAISGGNIAILAGAMLAVFRWAGFFGPTALVAASVALVGYGYLVGGGASVDRATLMALVYFAGRAVDHRSPPANTLAVVAALLVASDPLSVIDPAFVLTFGATLAILIAMPAVQRRRVPFKPVMTMFAASVAAETVLFPVSALVFSRVTFAGLALNFLAIPMMAIAQIAGMLIVPVRLASTRAAALVGFLAHLGAAGLVWSADLVRFAPALAYRVATPSPAVVAMYYLALAMAWIGWRRRMSTTVAVAAAIWILAAPAAFVIARGDGRLHATFVDVGQGDSGFVRFPRGSTLLVDAGGLSTSSTFDIGDRVVAPVLRSAGVRRLDYLALTHGDPDHIGGAASVIREFRPREVWEGIPVPRFAPLTALRLEAQSFGARWSNVYVNDHLTVDGVEVRVGHPPAADWERQRVRNDDSLVIELRWRDVSVVLTGDIGKAVERTLAAAIQPAAIRVLKVPHHGSLTSSTPDFIRAVRPTIAVVSVGRGNHFGHPAGEVLQRYRDAGAEIFRTDQDGAVMVDTDGRSIHVHSYAGRQLTVSSSPNTDHHEDAKTTKDTKK